MMMTGGVAFRLCSDVPFVMRRQKWEHIRIMKPQAHVSNALSRSAMCLGEAGLRGIKAGSEFTRLGKQG